MTDSRIAELQQEVARLRQICDLQERERQLIGYELHDGLMQHLAGAKMLAESLSTPNVGPAETLNSIVAALGTALAEGRKLIGDLRPTWIAEQGLIAALQTLIDEQAGRGATQLKFEQFVQFERLAPLLEASLYRIVQEALNNIRRHSRAAQASVLLVQMGKKLVLDIRDNGVGFDPSQPTPNHFGLEGIRLRAQLFDGWTTISSQPGQGTQIIVELPIAAESRPPGAGTELR